MPSDGEGRPVCFQLEGLATIFDQSGCSLALITPNYIILAREPTVHLFLSDLMPSFPTPYPVVISPRITAGTLLAILAGGRVPWIHDNNAMEM